ncbi:beta-glucosidase BglX [Streptococcus rifensis]
MQEKKLKELLSSLTIEEKIGQLIQLSGDFFGTDALTVGPREKLGISEEMVQNVGSVLNVLGAEKVRTIQENYLTKSRHKIPLLFMGDVVYGYRTTLPIPLGQGATWEPKLIKEGYQFIAKEASKAGTHVTFAPMVDLVRDPRWGRSLESTGEDTYLNNCYARAMVEGFQGDLGENTVVSCVKHFAAYGAPEGGRDYNTVDMSERRLRQDYLPSYKEAVDAGAKMVMTSFNTVDGIPATANKWLMNDVLRKEWGFDGVIITDYAAIQELVAHGIARDEREASQMAIEATVDIDMKTNCYSNQLKPLLENGEISETLINDAVWRVLKLKNDLGLFENPHRFADVEEETYLNTPEARQKALEISRKSLVLLKNDNNILPLNVKKQKIAVIGPYAESKELLGLWAVHSKSEDSVSIKEAFYSLEGKEVRFAKGSDFLEDYSVLGTFGKMVSGGRVNTAEGIRADLDEAIHLAKESDVVVLALGEHTLQSGEAGSRTDLGLPEIQQKLLDAIEKVGKPVVLVLFSGRPLVLTKIEKQVSAIIQAWFPGTMGGQAIVDVLTGKVNPSGRLTMSFPYNVGQIPIYYNAFNTGRPALTSTHSDRFVSKYIDAPNNPLYPFGYGLSYTEFEYTNLQVSSNKLTKDTNLEVSVDISNIGNVEGEETIQLYIRDRVGSVVRPVKELKDFRKIKLSPGESQKVIFEITEEKLRFVTKSLEYKSEAGEFDLFVGRSSEDYLQTEFKLFI